MHDRLAAGRNRVDDVARHDSLRNDVLHIHGRRLASDRYRFFERADTEINADVRRKRGSQLDALAADGIEALQRERHRIRAGYEIDDLVLTRGVGDARAHLLDE